jgi:hypothetical protein
MEVQESGRWGGSDDTALAPNSFPDGRILKGTCEYFRAFHYTGTPALFFFNTTFSSHFKVVSSSLAKNGVLQSYRQFSFSRVCNHYIAHIAEKTPFWHSDRHKESRTVQPRTGLHYNGSKSIKYAKTKGTKTLILLFCVLSKEYVLDSWHSSQSNPATD